LNFKFQENISCIVIIKVNYGYGYINKLKCFISEIIALKVHLVTQSCVSLGIYPKNFCIKQIFIQSVDQLIVFSIQKVYVLTYKLLSATNPTFNPITFSPNKTAIFPAETNFKLSDDGYNYIVRT